MSLAMKLELVSRVCSSCIHVCQEGRVSSGSRSQLFGMYLPSEHFVGDDADGGARCRCGGSGGHGAGGERYGAARGRGMQCRRHIRSRIESEV